MDQFLAKLFAAAKDANLSAAEAYIVKKESFEATSTNQEITQYSANSTSGLSFRAMYNGRMGYASTEAFDDLAIAQLIQGVIDSARLCEDTDEEFLHEGTDHVSRINLYNAALEDVTPQQKLDFVLQLEREAKAFDPRIEKVGYNTIFTTRKTVRIVNTYGMDRQYDENYCGAYLEPIAHEGDSTTAGMEMAIARDFAKLDAKTLGTDAAKIAVSGLHAKPISSGSYRVIFQNVAMTELLGAFTGVFSAEAAQKGLSLLKGKIGEQIAAAKVTVIDDPLMEKGLGSYPFDDEGVAAAKHTIVENGKFLTFLHNLKTAHKDGVKSTGNGNKAGYAASVRIAPSNFYFAPGTKTLDELMADAGEGLLITELTGLHAGANAVSGDFSLLSKGFFFQGGKRVKPVEQITVAGNFFELLQSIRELGVDLRFPQGGIGSPSIDAGELSVAGV